ncbi:unnamed protein product [Linum tenue]|uniref:Uncharacterized protein n=1 Tax=Linum tenue TaxID=586396 RepID=A0AAV0R5W0_9ROSI|nr:unnamed protein product [Linum tenue]
MSDGEERTANSDSPTPLPVSGRERKMKFARPVKYTAPSLFFRSSFPLSSRLVLLIS